MSNTDQSSKRTAVSEMASDQSDRKETKSTVNMFLIAVSTAASMSASLAYLYYRFMSILNAHIVDKAMWAAFIIEAAVAGLSIT